MELQNKPRKKKIEMEVQRFLDEMNRQLKATSIRKKKKNEREKRNKRIFNQIHVSEKNNIQQERRRNAHLSNPALLVW